MDENDEAGEGENDAEVCECGESEESDDWLDDSNLPCVKSPVPLLMAAASPAFKPACDAALEKGAVNDGAAVPRWYDSLTDTAPGEDVGAVDEGAGETWPIARAAAAAAAAATGEGDAAAEELPEATPPRFNDG